MAFVAEPRSQLGNDHVSELDVFRAILLLQLSQHLFDTL